MSLACGTRVWVLSLVGLRKTSMCFRLACLTRLCIQAFEDCTSSLLYKPHDNIRALLRRARASQTHGISTAVRLYCLTVLVLLLIRLKWEFNDSRMKVEADSLIWYVSAIQHI